ncbi:MAG: amidohydrolase family protein [Ilumatobacteraceae bacterium]
MEPGDLFVSRLPRRYREVAPREEVLSGRRVWFLDGHRTLTSTLYQLLPGDGPRGPDVRRRLRDLDADGIQNEVVYPNLGLTVMSIADDELAMACARIYNDDLADRYLPHRDRLTAIPIIPIVDIGSAVEEIERVAALGFRGILLPLVPHVPYYRLDRYAPIWAAAQAHRLPVSFHVGTGFVVLPNGTPIAASRARLSMNLLPAIGHAGRSGSADEPDPARTADAKRTIGALSVGDEARDLIAALVGSGTLDRFPELHIVSVENNANWLAWSMMAMDKAWTLGPGQPESFKATFHDGTSDPDTEPDLDLFGFSWPYPLMPSEYVRRQVHATFMDDVGAIAARHVTGIAPLLWASDYPHAEGTWPESRRALAALLDGVPDAEADAIVGGNLASLYGLEDAHA